MNKLLLGAVLLLALVGIGCDEAEAAKPAPKPPASGSEAMAIWGKERGKLETQPDGTYLLRYPNGSVEKVSASEVVLMPGGTR